MASDVEILAEQARQVLDNPAFKQAFYPLQVSVIDEIAETDISDGTRRDYLGLKLQVIREFEEQLLARLDDLKVEKEAKKAAEFDQPLPL